MDVLRKEINELYRKQKLHCEELSQRETEECRRQAELCVAVENDCRVITDAATATCWIYDGGFASLLGIGNGNGTLVGRFDSSDEDLIYVRIHPEDLVEKRMLEYEFFKFVDGVPPGMKLNYKATCRFRIKNREGNYIYVENSTRIARLSPGGRMWLILCCYSVASDNAPGVDIMPRIVNMATGEVIEYRLSAKRAAILTDREKEILQLIQLGMASKQIASKLEISINTVNRHRQNILEKLSVGNSVEAVVAARAMKLL